MMVKGSGGYTIIEVLLFLAISGLLLLIAFVGTGSTIRSVRFTDSGRSLEAFLQKQYDDIINGVNSRTSDLKCSAGNVESGNQAVGTSSCLLIGKLLGFTLGEGRITINNVVGTEPSGLTYESLSDKAAIAAFAPVAVTNFNTETYDIPWSATVSGTKRLSEPPASINYLLLVRSPKSSRVVSYAFNSPSQPTDLSAFIQVPANSGSVTNVCIKNADGFGSPAMLQITPGATQNAVQVLFDRVQELDCEA